MTNTRSHSATNPAAARKKKTNPEPIQNLTPVVADIPKAKPKAKPKPKASAADITEQLEKLPKNPKVSQVLSPDVELSNGDEPSTPSRKRRNVLAVAPRDPLPDRGTARQDIGGPDRKRAKRTTAQVKEDLAQKEEMKQRLKDMETEKLKLLARMELAQERDEAEEEASAVRGFENEFTPRTSHDRSLDEDGSLDEEFVEVNDGGDDDADVVSPAKSLAQKVRVC